MRNSMVAHLWANEKQESAFGIDILPPLKQVGFLDTNV